MTSNGAVSLTTVRGASIAAFIASSLEQFGDLLGDGRFARAESARQKERPHVYHATDSIGASPRAPRASETQVDHAVDLRFVA
jgi:hypothetical protein